MKTPKFITNIVEKIKKSFSLAWQGKEKMLNILLWWGGLSFIICYFLINPLVELSKEIAPITIILSLLIIIYYIWHIIVIRKCSPKKPKLTKKEKAQLKEEKKKEMSKAFARKLFLKEPISKWNPPFMITVIDIYIILLYTTHILT